MVCRRRGGGVGGEGGVYKLVFYDVYSDVVHPFSQMFELLIHQ